MPMKTFVCTFLSAATLAQATPPILSLTQVALQTVDPEIKPDHCDIARADLDGDGAEEVLR